MYNLFKLVLINDMSAVCLPLAGSGGWCSSLGIRSSTNVISVFHLYNKMYEC